MRGPSFCVAPPRRPNVLFVMCDDLCCGLACYGDAAPPDGLVIAVQRMREATQRHAHGVLESVHPVDPATRSAKHVPAEEHVT